MSNETFDYYAVLQVDARAEPPVIEAAYRKLAARYHPDVNPEPSAAEMMSRLNQARDTLLDPVARRRYDAQRQVSVGPFGPFGGAGPDGQMGGPPWLRHPIVQTLLQYVIQLVVGGVVMTLVFEVMPRLKQYSVPIILIVIALWFFWLKPIVEKNWGVGGKKSEPS